MTKELFSHHVKQEISYRNEFRKNLKLALPIMGGQLGQITVNVADNLMVGHLGAAALAAVSLSIAVFVIFFIVGMGISFALPPLVAEASGAGNNREISQYFKHSLLMNIIYAIVSFAMIELGRPLLYFMGQEKVVVDLAMPYLSLAAWSMIPLMTFQTFRCYSDGMSETLPPMIAMLIGNALNVFFNYILIFGKWGFPELGVTGAALGTLTSRVVMLFILVGLLVKWKGLWTHIRNADYLAYQRRVFRRMLSLGVPTSLQMFFEVSAFAGAALLMGMISKEAQAAHQIAINLASITFLICTGLAMACTVRVGNQLGKNDLFMARQAGLSAIYQVMVFMLITALIFVIFRFFLPTLYIDDPMVIGMAASLLIMAAIFQIPDGVQVTALGALRGLQDVNVPSLITFLAYWVLGLPVSYIAAFHLEIGPVGVWLGLVIGLSTSAFLLTMRFLAKTSS